VVANDAMQFHGPSVILLPISPFLLFTFAPFIQFYQGSIEERNNLFKAALCDYFISMKIGRGQKT
jgi:hypothetical protein